MKVFLVATEESGDRLGAALMQALRAKLGSSVEFRGVGGYEMAAQGLPSLFRIDDLAIVGLAGITQALPKIIARIRQTVRAALDERPDVMVIVDSPDFTHRVARRVRRKNRAIPVVNYVSPSVWAWRPGRARAMSRYVDHVLALLPFEPDVHKKLGGPPCTYVGHPLVEQIDELRPSTAEAERRMNGTPLLLVLPGSRKNEIRRLIDPFGRTIERIAKTVWPLDIAIPTTPHLQDLVLRETARWPLRPKILVKREDRRAAFRAARAALAKSGTVTLELGISGVPMVTAYKMAPWEIAIARRLIRVPSVILTNLVLGENVVPEFIQADCTPDRLSATLLPLLSDSPERRRQVEALARLDGLMQIGQAQPALRAAEIVHQVAMKSRVPT